MPLRGASPKRSIADSSSRAHVLLLAHNSLDTVLAVVRECFVRVLEQAWPRCRLRRRHRRRKVDQPMRINRKAAHDVQRSRCILFPDGYFACERGLDKPFTEHVAHIEQVVALWSTSRQGTCWLVVDACRRHRDQFLFRIPQRTELTSESTPGVDIHGVVQPARLRHCHMAVNDHRASSIVLRPIKADRKAEFVRLAGGLSVQREIANPT